MEISKETLDVLYANYDGDFSRDEEHLNEAVAVLNAAESERFSVSIEV